MSEIYTVPQLRDTLTPVLSRYGVRSAILFGSYGKGTATEKSDVDLLVDSGLRGLRFVGLMDDLRRATGKDVDLFDVTHIQADSPIDNEIRTTGVTVYEK
ncbi:MAG: nucleotidyltransferase domain-containing protein [Clostridia bacterium]|nr:nucleotidyltransferase domain-containing protein [Clostridia bacterium]